MISPSDHQRLANLGVELVDAVGRREGDSATSTPAILARTRAVGTYPTTAAVYYALTPLQLLGAEVEGGAGSITAADQTIYALNLGETVPPQSTQVVATFVGHRWVFRYD